MIGPGWSWTAGGPTDERSPLPTATILDLDPDQGLRSPEVLVRPYVTGRPDPAAFAALLSQEPQVGRRVQCLNEINLPLEGWTATPADYAAWFIQVADRAPAGARLYWMPPSPGVFGWQSYYTDPACADAIGRAAGLSVHGYGTCAQMLEVLDFVLAAWPGKPVWVSECNFGAGQGADVDAWAHNELAPFLDACAARPAVESVCYFAPYWDQSGTLPTSVDGFGTAVETVLHEWVPPDPPDPPDPEEPTVTDIVLSVPMKTAMASSANYQPGPRASTVGVVIHTTRGNASSLAAEYNATVNWFADPDAQVSSHLVVGPEEVARCVHDNDVAWHCRSANSAFLGIEIAQPTLTSAIADFQYRAAAEACRKWAGVYGFPLERVMTCRTPGLIGHEDSEPGRADGKTDPGVPPAGVFDWERFLALCRPGTAPAAFDIDAARDQLWAIAGDLETNGWPWFGNAVKSAVTLSKGEH